MRVKNLNNVKNFLSYEEVNIGDMIIFNSPSFPNYKGLIAKVIDFSGPFVVSQHTFIKVEFVGGIRPTVSTTYHPSHFGKIIDIDIVCKKNI